MCTEVSITLRVDNVHSPKVGVILWSFIMNSALKNTMSCLPETALEHKHHSEKIGIQD